MNNIFCFDIDGTLSREGIIPSSALNCIKKIREKGDKVVLATGRCYGQMADVLEKITVDGAIINNGAFAELNGQCFSSHPIPRKVIDKLLEDKLHVAFLLKDAYLRVEEHPIFQEFSDNFHLEGAKISDRSCLEKPIYSLGVYSNQIDTVDVSLYPELDFIQVAPNGFDVILSGIHKGTAVWELKKKYKDARIIAFGDNVNDMEMLKAADIAIVMPRAPKIVRDLADFVTKDVFEDGIEYAIKEYLKYED